MKKDVIWCDFEIGDDWVFLKGLNKATNKDFKIEKQANNKVSTKLDNIVRYIKYFAFAFNAFLHRKSYKSIVSWQQFYGLIYAFFSRLFHVKKQNFLAIMTFIYIPKRGLVGKIYKKFISYIITSEYIDMIFLYSTSEGKRYAKEFGVSEDKFVFVPLGHELGEDTSKCDDIEEGFLFASGYSNRDFDFLSTALKGTQYTVRIYGRKNVVDKNIIMSDERIEAKTNSMLEKCRVVLVPLKENREAGQLTVLHAMKAGRPVVATNADCMKDYIVDGVNGFLCPNDAKVWLEKIDMLCSDDKLYNRMSKQCKDIYESKHTGYAMGMNVGEKILTSNLSE